VVHLYRVAVKVLPDYKGLTEQNIENRAVVSCLLSDIPGIFIEMRGIREEEGLDNMTSRTRMF
jgi:hypothetical protein